MKNELFLFYPPICCTLSLGLLAHISLFRIQKYSKTSSILCNSIWFTENASNDQNLVKMSWVNVHIQSLFDNKISSAQR